jgi:hypothetical protein
MIILFLADLLELIFNENNYKDEKIDKYQLVNQKVFLTLLLSQTRKSTTSNDL